MPAGGIERIALALAQAGAMPAQRGPNERVRRVCVARTTPHKTLEADVFQKNGGSAALFADVAGGAWRPARGPNLRPPVMYASEDHRDRANREAQERNRYYDRLRHSPPSAGFSSPYMPPFPSPAMPTWPPSSSFAPFGDFSTLPSVSPTSDLRAIEQALAQQGIKLAELPSTQVLARKEVLDFLTAEEATTYRNATTALRGFLAAREQREEPSGVTLARRLLHTVPEFARPATLAYLEQYAAWVAPTPPAERIATEQFAKITHELTNIAAQRQRQSKRPPSPAK